jgi:hypothetical protein
MVTASQCMKCRRKDTSVGCVATTLQKLRSQQPSLLAFTATGYASAGVVSMALQRASNTESFHTLLRSELGTDEPRARGLRRRSGVSTAERPATFAARDSLSGRGAIETRCKEYQERLVPVASSLCCRPGNAGPSLQGCDSSPWLSASLHCTSPRCVTGAKLCCY